MYFNTITMHCAIIVPLVSAGCYSGGTHGNTQLALDNIGNVAKLLQGTLNGGQERAHCLTDKGNGNQWYFSITNTGRNIQTVVKNDIDDYLRMEVSGCGTLGGSSKHGWTRYTADPNSGVCIDAHYINEHEPATTPKPPRRRGTVIPRWMSSLTFTDVSDDLLPQPKAPNTLPEGA